jgi:hypothetical protein
MNANTLLVLYFQVEAQGIDPIDNITTENSKCS